MIWNKSTYIDSAAVTMFPLLFKTVPTDRRRLQALVVGFVEQAAGPAVRQVALIGAAAAAAERARNIPAGEGKKQQHTITVKPRNYRFF